jgi:4a-hydroxytetrahydrobiopterin dehydratase
MSRKRFTDDELAAAVQSLPGWTLQNGRLHRDYEFPDFAHAMGFMATAAPMIEKRDHHPEWSNVYNRVAVDLTTHDSGGITKMDTDLAMVLEGIARKLL